MSHVYVKQLADGLRPANFSRARIAYEGGVGRIDAHAELPGAAQHQVIVDIQPFVQMGE